MNERDEILTELEHLLRYYTQASRDFFSESQEELAERIGVLRGCLEKKAGTLEQVRELIGLLAASQESLGKRVEDLNFLTARMLELLDGKLRAR